MAESKLELIPDFLQNPWNFKIHVFLSLVKGLYGEDSKFENAISEMKKMFKPQVPCILGIINEYFQLKDSLLCTQHYEALDVGSVAEDVPIYRLFRQFHEEPEADLSKDIKLKKCDIYWECDFNLCFKDIMAAESTHHSSDSNSKNVSLELQIIPTSMAGQVHLAVPPDMDCLTVSGLSQLCIQDDQGSTILSSELLVNELFSLLTLTITIMNVAKCQNQSLYVEKGEAQSCFAESPQYVGQAGPAVHIVTYAYGLFITEDVSISVPCSIWPSCAKEWSVRSRPSGWPSKNLIEQVVRGGSHLVPKYDQPKGNHFTSTAYASASTPKTEWRYSFSLAEKQLMGSITDEQKKCYLVFKYLFSRFVKIESVITTYTAKTLFLWELESITKDLWSFSLIGDRVKTLFEKFRICVENKYCKHYFIDGCNILHQMDDKSQKVTLESNLPLLYEEMAEIPDIETGIFETQNDFPVYLVSTYKTFYHINVWLETLSFQMKGKLEPASKIPSEQTIQDFLDNSKVHPFQMPEILIHLTQADKVYGQSLPVPKSLLKQERVMRLIQFLERSTTPARFEECMEDLDIQLKFLHLQCKIIEEIEQNLTDNPETIYSFERSDESETEEGEVKNNVTKVIIT